jgi:hypothetical protein
MRGSACSFAVGQTPHPRPTLCPSAPDRCLLLLPLALLQDSRARRYESYEEPDSPAAAHTALAANKQQAVALAELHAKRQSLKAQGHPGLGSSGGYRGLAAMEAGAAAGAGGSASPSAAGAAGGYQPFSIGTEVHSDEGPDLV